MQGCWKSGPGEDEEGHEGVREACAFHRARRLRPRERQACHPAHALRGRAQADC